MCLSGLEFELRERRIIDTGPRDVRWDIAGIIFDTVSERWRLRAVEAATSVDEQAITGRRDDRHVSANSIGDNAKVRQVVPITEHDRANVDIIRELGRTVDHDWSHDTSGVLR